MLNTFKHTQKPEAFGPSDGGRPKPPGLVDLMEHFLRWSQASPAASGRSDALGAFAAAGWRSVGRGAQMLQRNLEKTQVGSFLFIFLI